MDIPYYFCFAKFVWLNKLTAKNVRNRKLAISQKDGSIMIFIVNKYKKE